MNNNDESRARDKRLDENQQARDSIDNAWREEVNTQLETLKTKVDALPTAETIKRTVDEAVSRAMENVPTRDEMRRAVRSGQEEVRDELRKELRAEMDTRLRSVTLTIDESLQAWEKRALAHIDTNFERIDDAHTARDTANKTRIESLGRQIENTQRTITAFQNDLTALDTAKDELRKVTLRNELAITGLHASIFGDPTKLDGPPSLFKMNELIRDEIKAGSANFTQQITLLQEEYRSIREWVELERKTKEARQRRIAFLKKYSSVVLGWVAQNKILATIIGGILIGLIARLSPEITQFVQELFDLF